MKYSVVIAERNEPDLKNTVANIKRNNDAHVIVMSDKQGLGPQAMRDKGIGLAAGSDVVIVMDGHMRTKKGSLDAMAEWVRANPNSVACAQCFHSYEESWTGQPYSGARFAWTSYGKDASEPQALSGKWRTDHSVGRIPCVMGACYSFSRSWYMDGLRKPWQYGTGWGCDEEILSAATWLRGGTVELLPIPVWHKARKPGQVPYRISDLQLIGVWANRLRLLDMMPMSESERAELVKHIMPALTIRQWRQVNSVNDIQESMEYRNFLSTGPMDWSYFKENIVEMETVKVPTMKEMRATAKKIGLKVPFGCKKSDLGKLIQDSIGWDEIAEILESGEGQPETPKKRQSNGIPRANWGPKERNMKGSRCCPSCDGTESRINKVIPGVGWCAGRRYRECLACGELFQTIEEK